MAMTERGEATTGEATPIVAETSGAAPGRQRADSARTRARLVAATGKLLAERGPAFTLPDLARRSGVSVATTYRHFDDVFAAFDAYYNMVVGDLIGSLDDLSETGDPRRAFDHICEEWVRQAASWGRAATHIRSAVGYLERLRDGDPDITRLHAILATVVDALVASGEVSAIDTDYAALLWITIFDERVIVDLASTLGWSAARIARTLRASLLGAWTAPAVGS